MNFTSVIILLFPFVPAVSLNIDETFKNKFAVLDKCGWCIMPEYPSWAWFTGQCWFKLRVFFVMIYSAIKTEIPMDVRGIKKRFNVWICQ